MKKPQIRFRSFYAKLVIMFLFMGLIPFLLMGMLIYNVYSNTMYENILGNFSMTDQIMAKNISDLITEIADIEVGELLAQEISQGARENPAVVIGVFFGQFDQSLADRRKIFTWCLAMRRR